MFVVDDLVGWLIGRLADAGYQKLSTRLRGSDQDRALKAAVTAAVQTTTDEISPAGYEQADRLAEHDQRDRDFAEVVLGNLLARRAVWRLTISHGPGCRSPAVARDRRGLA